MLYCSWHMACGRCNCYFSFWAVFCPFTPVTARKMKISKKWKKYPEISFHTSVPNIMIICYTVPERWHVTHVIFFFQLGQYFTLLAPSQSKKWKFQKNGKSAWRNHHFTHAYQKLWLDNVQLLRKVWDGWMDKQNGQTDRQKKWHIEVSAPP